LRAPDFFRFCANRAFFHFCSRNNPPCNVFFPREPPFGMCSLVVGGFCCSVYPLFIVVWVGRPRRGCSILFILPFRRGVYPMPPVEYRVLGFGILEWWWGSEVPVLRRPLPFSVAASTLPFAVLAQVFVSPVFFRNCSRAVFTGYASGRPPTAGQRFGLSVVVIVVFYPELVPPCLPRLFQGAFPPIYSFFDFGPFPTPIGSGHGWFFFGCFCVAPFHPGKLHPYGIVGRGGIWEHFGCP